MKNRYSPPLFLGCDIGTFSVKTMILDSEGRALGSSQLECPPLYPKPLWAEQDPELWWRAAEKTMKEVIKKTRIERSDIEGICISGLAPGCVPMDTKGKPLRNAILWIDRRATEECTWMKSKIGLDKVYATSGNTLDPYFGGPKWLWFKNHESNLYQKTWKLAQGQSYLVFKLTGEMATDFSHGGLCTPYFDLEKKQWSEEICELTRIPIDKLPELYPSHKVIGEITGDAASKTSLLKGTKVVTGGGDFACSALSCGVIGFGEACQMLGTAGNLLIPMGKKIKPDPSLINTVHVTGEYLTLGSTLAGGLVQWFKDQLAFPEIAEAKERQVSPFMLLDKKAEKIAPGSNGLIVLPYFMGERTPIWDAYARGLFLGLNTCHTRIHMYRAVLESVAYAFRHMMETAEKRGTVIKKIISVNGGARSRLWRQIFADVLGIPIQYVANSGGAPMGGAVLAGIGTGAFKDFSIVKEWLNVTDINEPDEKAHKNYLKYYSVYRNVYGHLKQDFEDLQSICGEGQTFSV